MERVTGEAVEKVSENYTVDPMEKLYDKFIFAGMILVIIFGFSVVSLVTLTIWGYDF